MYICEVWRIEYILLNMYRFEILRLQLLGSPQTSGGWHRQCFELGPLHTFSSVCWQLGCPPLRNSCSSLDDFLLGRVSHIGMSLCFKPKQHAYLDPGGGQSSRQCHSAMASS